MSGVDVLAVMDRLGKEWRDDSQIVGRLDSADALDSVRAAVAELIEHNQRLTKAVRAFADGEMSDAMRKRLFFASSDEPAKDAFADLCTANDECEAALSRVRGAE